MSNKWYARNPADFIDGVADMDLELIGAYGLLLDFIYLYDRPLRDNDSYICGLLKCHILKWRSIRTKLLSLGKLVEIEGGYLDNPRAITERSTRNLLLTSRQLAGHLGGVASGQARKNKKLAEAKIEASELHNITQHNKIDRGAKAPPKRASQIPEGWEPNPETLSTLKTKRGFQDSEIKSELPKFRDFHQATGSVFKDHEAAFRTWMAKSREFAGARGSPASKGNGHSARGPDSWVAVRYDYEQKYGKDALKKYNEEQAKKVP